MLLVPRYALLVRDQGRVRAERAVEGRGEKESRSSLTQSRGCERRAASRRDFAGILCRLLLVAASRTVRTTSDSSRLDSIRFDPTRVQHIAHRRSRRALGTPIRITLHIYDMSSRSILTVNTTTLTFIREGEVTEIVVYFLMIAR